jgi:hypothetical protein
MTIDEIKGILYGLHHSTFRNETQIKSSHICGCFYCKSIFNPEDVVQWCDNDGRGEPTALCPHCGIDSVIGDACGMRITPSLLELMNLQFFGEGIDNLKIQIVNEKDET